MGSDECRGIERDVCSNNWPPGYTGRAENLSVFSPANLAFRTPVGDESLLSFDFEVFYAAVTAAKSTFSPSTISHLLCVGDTFQRV